MNFYFLENLQLTRGSMSFWVGHFKTDCNQGPRDTFLKVTGWHKGLAFVNGVNLGRYWPVEGPQETLYVPGAYLMKDCQYSNEIILFEQDHPPCIDFLGKFRENSTNYYQTGSLSECNVEFVTEPKIDGATPIGRN